MQKLRTVNRSRIWKGSRMDDAVKLAELLSYARLRGKGSSERVEQKRDVDEPPVTDNVYRRPMPDITLRNWSTFELVLIGEFEILPQGT